MPVQPPLVLIVDGNNLAHHIHHFPTGKAISTGDIQLLAMQLSLYVRTSRRPIVIELGLDRFHPDHPLPVLGGVLVFVASPPEKADDVILERFRFHYHQGHECLVVTNDTEVRECVQDEGGGSLLVYDFVRRGGKKPVFRDPLEFASLIHLGEDWLSEPTIATFPILEPVPGRRFPGPTPAHAPQVAPPPLEPQPEPEPPAIQTEPDIATHSSPAGIYGYRLTLDQWPLEAGVRFLLDSFYQQHGAEYRNLYASIQGDHLRTADVTGLAKALVELCGNEPGFATRGSLIDRVRLALLLSPDEVVSLSEIVARTGLNNQGLHGRIKEKARKWLEIEKVL